MTILLYDLVAGDETRPYSPYCWRAKLALAHKGLDFTARPVRLLDVPALEGGVSKTVPIIRDGDRVVADSFAIAEYLEDAYPDRPSLFGGEGGRASARMLESFAFNCIMPYLVTLLCLDICNAQDEVNRAYYRESREKRFGKSLEQVSADSRAQEPVFRAAMAAIETTLGRQPFIGGQAPLFSDYILFVTLQLPRLIGGLGKVEIPGRVAAWMETCLKLHGGLAGKVPAAA